MVGNVDVDKTNLPNNLDCSQCIKEYLERDHRFLNRMHPGKNACSTFYYRTLKSFHSKLLVFVFCGICVDNCMTTNVSDTVFFSRQNSLFWFAPIFLSFKVKVIKRDPWPLVAHFLHFGNQCMCHKHYTLSQFCKVAYVCTYAFKTYVCTMSGFEPTRFGSLAGRDATVPQRHQKLFQRGSQKITSNFCLPTYIHTPKFFWPAYQGCQMVYLHTKITNFGIFWRALEWKMWLYFMAINVVYILRPLGTYIFLFVYYLLLSFGINIPFLVIRIDKNLATLLHT
jgi:hypothetical protein